MFTKVFWHASPGWRIALALPCSSLLLAAAGPAAANVVISNAATSNVACSAGVCTATAASAVLNQKQLAQMLASGNAKVATGTIGGGIQIGSDLSWASTNTLTLDSSTSIRIDQPVSVTGAGGVALVTNDGGTGGSLSFGSRGNITFSDLSSELTINGIAYTLVNSIATLASGANANSSGNFALANDYNAQPDGVYSTAPVPDLYGNFEGLGHSITNFSLTGGDPSAFFGTAINIENFSLQNVHIVGGNSFPQYTAGLVGEGGGIVANVTVTGTIEAGSATFTSGFIAAQFLGSSSLLRNAYASGQLIANGGTQIGGLIGLNLGTITRSSADVEITGSGSGVGGLVGVSAGSIWDSFALGPVSGVDYVGGLIGANAGSAVRSYATGTVTGMVGASGASDVGGFAGISEPSQQYVPRIADSYSTGAVSGGTNAGGFVGANQSPIATSYATGSVSGASVMGGFVGDDTSTHGIKHSYWDTTTGIASASQGAGNAANDHGLSGLTTLQLQSGLPGNFDSNIWGESPTINGGLPYLLALPPK